MLRWMGSLMMDLIVGIIYFGNGLRSLWTEGER
jgi:hypothetical protein